MYELRFLLLTEDEYHSSKYRKELEMCEYAVVIMPNGTQAVIKDRYSHPVGYEDVIFKIPIPKEMINNH